MKNLVKLFIVLMMGCGFVANATSPVLTRVPVEEAYSPQGFDSNDSVEIVIAGALPNLCFKAPQTSFEIIANKILIEVKAQLHSENKELFCASVIVPFLESVNVGILDKGVYQVIVNGENRSAIKIVESTSSAIDDYIYANVKYIVKTEGSRIVQLKGYNPSYCFEFDQVKIISNGKNVYSVLPIMKQVSSFCPMKMIPFEIDVEVPSTLDADKVLLHVRVMDGRSVNTTFSN